MIDSHCHLDHEPLKSNLDNIIKRAKEIGVTKPLMYDAADDAITLEGVSKAEAKNLLFSDIGIDRKKIEGKPIFFLNMKGSLSKFKGKNRSKNLDAEIKLMAKIADNLFINFS